MNFPLGNRRFLLATLVVWLGFSASTLAEGPIGADPPAAKPATDVEPLPPALKEYQGRTIAQTMHYEGAPWLTRENREREEECSTLLKNLGIKPGMTVCDLGCGNGFYTLKVAEMVGPKGRVLAVDIQSEMLRLLSERAKETKIANVEPILGTLIDPRLPEGKVELILCVDVYHEFSHPVHMLAALRKSLAPGGVWSSSSFAKKIPKCRSRNSTR